MVSLNNVVRNSLTIPTSYWLFQSTSVSIESVQKYLTWPGICTRHMRDKQWFLELVIEQWVEQQASLCFSIPCTSLIFCEVVPSNEGLALTTCFSLCCARVSKWGNINYALLQALNCILCAWNFIYIMLFFLLLFYHSTLGFEDLSILLYLHIFYCFLSLPNILVCILYILYALFQISSSKCLPPQITQVNILNLVPS